MLLNDEACDTVVNTNRLHTKALVLADEGTTVGGQRALNTVGGGTRGLKPGGGIFLLIGGGGTLTDGGGGIFTFMGGAGTLHDAG